MTPARTRASTSEVVELPCRADGVGDRRLELARRREDRLAVPEALDRRGGVDVGRVGRVSALRADLPAGIVEPAAPGMFAPVLHLPAAGAPPSVHRLAAAVALVGFIAERLDDADVEGQGCERGHF